MLSFASFFGSESSVALVFYYRTSIVFAYLKVVHLLLSARDCKLITISCVQRTTSCVCKILYSLDVLKYAQRQKLISINRFYHMARLALLARFHRKADLCRAGRVCVSWRPFLEMPGNLTGSRQYFKIKILGREKQPGNLSIPFCFFS